MTYNPEFQRFWKKENSKKEKVTEIIEETWLVEDGEKIKLIENKY